MNFKQLQQQWRQQTIMPGNETMNAESLIQQCRHVDKQAKERTLYGTLAFGLIMVFLVVFNYFLYLLGTPLLALVSIASWVVVLLVNGIRLWFIQRQQPTMDTAVADHLRMKLAVVEREKSFYLSLWKWLTLPLGIGLSTLVFSLQSGMQGIDLLYLVAYVVAAVVAHNHCKKIVRSKLQPLAEQLNVVATFE